MKKLFVLLLALIMCAGAFAQVTASGYIRVTSKYYANESLANADDKGANMLAERFRINLAGTDADGNFGFSARFQDDKVVGSGTVGDFTMPYAYGWAKFLGGMGKVTVGYLDDTSYHFSQNEANNEMGNVDAGFEYEKDAVLVQLTPVEGLSLGLFYAPDNAKLNGNEFAAGASYAVPELLNVKTGWYFDSKLVGQVGVEYVGVKDLSAVVGLKADTAAETNTIYTIIGYTMDKLFVEVAGNYQLDPSAYYFEGNVEYTMPIVSVRGFIGYAGAGDDIDLMDTLGYEYYGGTKALGNRGDINELKVGVEFAIPFSTKGEISIRPQYLDKTGFVLPMYAKVSF